jgi:hypothetical protein
MLIEMGPCPFCKNGYNTPCFAKYTDGYKCFRCQAFKKADRSFIKRVSLKERVLLPEYNKSFSTFSYDNQKWLYKYYLDETLIRKYKIGEGDEGQLIIPVFDDKEVYFYIERWVDPKRYKHHGKKIPVTNYSTNRDKTIVIVEDWISCIRVGQLYNSMCLFGTYCDKDTAKKLVYEYDKIFIWLDGDEAGINASTKLKQSLDWWAGFYERKRAYEIPDKKINVITTSRDPKEYNNERIKNEITKEPN